MMDEIAGFKIRQLLREGNFGTFYITTPPDRLQIADADVTLKVMIGAASDDEFRRFANELRIFASLRSPYLATLYEAGNADGTLYYAMESFPDGSLEEPARELTLAERAGAGAAAARGAHDLHEAGVVHRDIKPANILLAGGHAKLADLGLTHIMTPGQTFTGRGPIGTVEFMAPAMIHGEPASRATDTWSLAVSLHWALTGSGVYGRIPTQNVVDALRHVLSTTPAVAPSLSEGWRGLLETCLIGEPEQRPRTAAQLADGIEEVASR